MLGNGSGDRPLQYYATAKQRVATRPFGIGYRGCWQGRSIWTWNQGMLSLTEAHLCLS